MPNNVGARTQPCLTPLQIGKVLDMEPSNWTLAFMFSWNATRMESSVSGQPSSLSMLYKPDRLTVSRHWSGLWKPHTAGVQISSWNDKVKTDLLLRPGFPNLFTISYHLGTPYCQRVPLLPEQLIWSNLSLFRRIVYIKIPIKDQLNLTIFLFLFAFHQLVDAWRKFVNSASKVMMLRYNRNSKL